MMIVALGALLTPGARLLGRGSPGEPAEDREPLPVLRGYRLTHAGEFVAPDEASPCLPARERVALRLAGAFVGATVLELSQTGGRTWSAVLRDDRPVLLSAPGAICIGGFAFGESLAFVRARCMSMTAGPIGWQLSSW